MPDPVERLERADADRREARNLVNSTGEGDLRTLRESVDELRELLSSYEDRAVGSEDFAAFIEFQERIERFTNRLPDDLLERETFDTIVDLLQQRRLSERDFSTAWDRIETLEATLEPLDEWKEATDNCRTARRDVRRRLDDVIDEISDLERLQRLGAADLSASTDRLRDPIERYDEAVSAAFDAFKRDESARTVFDLLRTTRHFPLVPFRDPPVDLLDFVESHAVGTESLSQLLEYAGYSRSKLDHYVDDADALKRNVATHQTYIERLDAGPLTVGWPPPSADVLRWQCNERISVVGRFAPDVVPALRDVRKLTRREEYEPLRASAAARAQLTREERERIQRGTVDQRLDEARTERERLEATLAAHSDG